MLLLILLLLPSEKPDYVNNDQWSLYQAECRLRESRGLESKVLNKELCQAAQRRAIELQRVWGHRNYQAYAREAGYTGSVGENIAKWSGGTPERSMSQWEHSPGHYAQIVGGRNDVGYGWINGHAVGLYGSTSSTNGNNHVTPSNKTRRTTRLRRSCNR